MKNLKVCAIAVALCLSLGTAVFAFGKLTRAVSAQTAAACCADASCCTGGSCKMNGSCCGDSCTAQKTAVVQKADYEGVPVEHASGNNGDKGDCCAGGGSSCCQSGGSACCKSKAKAVTAKL